MTNDEYLAIINDPKRKLTNTQIYIILREILRDATDELEDRNPKTIEQERWICGMINGLDIAISLLEHVERN